MPISQLLNARGIPMWVNFGSGGATIRIYNNFPDIRDRSNRSLIDFQFPKDGSGVL
jgi:hypothetical protein